MLDCAVIQLGLKPREFWEMTFVNFMRMLVHNAYKEAKEWERTRSIVTILHNVNAKHPKSPEVLMPLWTDKLRKSKNQISEEEFKQLIEKSKKWHKKN